ncbi:MAG: peptidoglycan-binding protein [Defluviitaleaceae bacterium]|nr:peptidoglycan-binding protein [Defluviitaleaceae bacterium]
MNSGTHLQFQYGTWTPTLQIGNGIIQGQYRDQVGHWTRVGHQVYVNGFFRLSYTEAQVEDALRRNTTVQEIRIGTLPYEANSSSSVFNLVVSGTPFTRNIRPGEIDVLATGARSIWGSPRLRVFYNERILTRSVNSTNRIPLASDLTIEDLRPSTNGAIAEIRVSGTYTAFPDLSSTDPVNTPPPVIIQPPITVPEPPSPPPQPPHDIWPQYPGVVLRRGMQGPSIKQVQERLNILGATPQLVNDGIFGPLTEAAVLAFQEQRNLNADGIVGVITWDELFRA